MSIFNKPFTLDQKINRIAEQITRDAQSIMSEWKRERDARERAEAAEANRQRVAALNAQIEAQRKQQEAERIANAPARFGGNGKALEVGKVYSFENVQFRVFDPTTLTEKQQSVVYRFIHDLYAPLNAPAHITFENVAPWLDVIFQFNRRQMSVGQFNQITGLNIEIDTFDARHQHNW